MRITENRLRSIIRSVILENMGSREVSMSEQSLGEGPIIKEDFDEIKDMLTTKIKHIYDNHMFIKKGVNVDKDAVKNNAYSMLSDLETILGQIPKEEITFKYENDKHFLSDCNFRGILQSFIDGVKAILEQPDSADGYRSAIETRYKYYSVDVKKYLGLCKEGLDSYTRAERFDSWRGGYGE
tara:strand:+ start:284 stop:829 length:546 start_codon:yes stop_codon:yes gene_type:complete